jgi:hypothetical protein
MKLLGFFCLLLAVFIGALTHGANFYQWTDAEGKVHYSDTPPPQTTDQQRKLNIAPTPTNAESRSPRGLRPGELEMLRNLDREQAATTPAETAESEELEETEQARNPDQNAEPLDEELCAKYSNLMEEINTSFGARQKARQARASGDYATYRALRTPRLRRRLQQEYQEKMVQHCQTP